MACSCRNSGCKVEIVLGVVFVGPKGTLLGKFWSVKLRRGIVTQPVAVLGLATYVICSYPSQVASGKGQRFATRYRFLLHRFKPDAYYYGLVLLYRNALVALMPTVLVGIPEVSSATHGHNFDCRPESSDPHSSVAHRVGQSGGCSFDRPSSGNFTERWALATDGQDTVRHSAWLASLHTSSFHVACGFSWICKVGPEASSAEYKAFMVSSYAITRPVGAA